jgi:transposase
MERKPYPTSLSDDQCELIEPLVPKAKSGGRYRSVNLRQVTNGIFYVVLGGIT